ncbi:MAG: sterol carrier protein domain-containing protein, partial [Clostridia bacterium]|nr:sterol carrier protein domain-containing protein [Clostridia bacterium]
AHEYPNKAGAFTVRVNDTMPSVAGTFRVCYGGGEVRVERLANDAIADVTLPETALVQLLYGYLSLDARSLAFPDGVEVQGDCEDLLRAFGRKPGGIFEHF